MVHGQYLSTTIVREILTDKVTTLLLILQPPSALQLILAFNRPQTLQLKLTYLQFSQFI